MALEAYPGVPLFRYPYTPLTEAQIAAKLAPAAQGGPGSKGALDTHLAGTNLRIDTEGAGTLVWRFGPGNRVTIDGREGGYGALLDHLTLIAHLVPGTATGHAIAWDRRSNQATVFELWWGGGPAPHTREINRAVWHGSVVGAGEVSGERHAPTLRMEGRAYAWTEDTGMRTVEYYPSVTYTHWVELDRLKEGRGYSAPADYVMLTEDLYLFARVEAEFSADFSGAVGVEEMPNQSTMLALSPCGRGLGEGSAAKRRLAPPPLLPPLRGSSLSRKGRGEVTRKGP